jgi:hypothetical protein
MTNPVTKNHPRLTFKHEIPVEIFAECKVSLEVLINDETVFRKQYIPGSTYNEKIEFDHEYTEGVKNKMTFMFSGEAEVEKKYLKILQICLNEQILNKYNAEYFPKINLEWWKYLTQKEKNKVNDQIYGKVGAHFGWYGEINFYYCAGFDYKSHFHYNTNIVDYTKILGEKINWVFLDKNSNSITNKIK